MSLYNKQETLKEAAAAFANKEVKQCDSYHDLHYGFVEGAKWQLEKSYSEEEVLNLIDRAFHVYASDYRNDAKEWFNQNKK